MIDALQALAGATPPSLAAIIFILRMSDTLKELAGSVKDLNKNVAVLDTHVQVLQKTVEIQNGRRAIP
jgi:uncharacterized protein YoxC